MRNHDIGILILTLFGLALLGPAVSAQEKSGEIRPRERVRVLVTSGGVDMEITLIDGKPASCRLEGENLTMSTDPGGTIRFVGPEGRETVRILRDTVSSAETGQKKSVRLGIKVAPPSDLICSQLGLALGSSLAVTAVEPGLAAERAGLRQHDIIIAIGDSLGANEEKLAREVRDLKPGKILYLHVRRDSGHSLNIEIKAEETDWETERDDLPIQSGLPILGFLYDEKSRGHGDKDTEALGEPKESAPQDEGDTPAVDLRALGQRADWLRYQELMMLQGPRGTERVLAEISKVDQSQRILRATLEQIQKQIAVEEIPEVQMVDEPGQASSVTTIREEQILQIRLDKLDERLARLEALMERLAAKLDE